MSMDVNGQQPVNGNTNSTSSPIAKKNKLDSTQISQLLSQMESALLSRAASGDSTCLGLFGSTSQSQTDFAMSLATNLPDQIPDDQKTSLASKISGFFAKMKTQNAEKKDAQKADELTDAQINEAIDLSELREKGIIQEISPAEKAQQKNPGTVSADEITPEMQSKAADTIKAKGQNLNRMKDIEKALKNPNLSKTEREALLKEATTLFDASESMEPISQVAGFENISTQDLVKSFETLRAQAGVPSGVYGQENYQKLADQGRLNSVEIEDGSDLDKVHKATKKDNADN